jgi:hypothetical protein
MDLEKVFKNFIIADLIFIVIFIVNEFFYQSEEVSTISDQLSFGIFDSETGSLLGFGFFLILLILYLISLFLLYRFMSFGKPLFTFVIISILLVSIFSGPTISTALGGVIDSIEYLIEGAILTFLYFTPIKDKFKSQ